MLVVGFQRIVNLNFDSVFFLLHQNGFRIYADKNIPIRRHIAGHILLVFIKNHMYIDGSTPGKL